MTAVAPSPLPHTSENDNAAWDEAFVRVESYLRAHRIERRQRLARLTDRLVQYARRNQRRHESPVATAQRITNDHIDHWLACALEREGELDTLSRRRARLAIEISDAATRWPDDFLADTPPPADLRAAMQSAYVEAGPRMAFSNMAPRPIDLGPVANLAGHTWDHVRRRPLIRTVLFWSVALLGSALLIHLIFFA